MYTPKQFQVVDRQTIQEFIDDNQFATLVSWNGKAPVATHLLLELETGANDAVFLNGHMSRANAQWQTFDPDQEVTGVFLGAHTYISPRWYSHVNVPTWNYLSVHAYGVPRIVTDHDEFYGMLKRLVDRYEAGSGAESPYRLESLPGDFIVQMMNGTVGFQIRVTRLEASYKLSQNRNPHDFQTIIIELERRGDEHSRAIAHAMKKIEETRDTFH